MTGARCRRAASTTDASMTSAVPAAPHSTPAARAPVSVSGSTRTPRAPSSRANLACRVPLLHTWPTTPAGTTTARCSCRAASMTAAVLRSPRSTAINAPASRTKLNAARPVLTAVVRGRAHARSAGRRCRQTARPGQRRGPRLRPAPARRRSASAHRLGPSVRNILASPLRNRRVEAHRHLGNSHTFTLPASGTS